MSFEFLIFASFCDCEEPISKLPLKEIYSTIHVSFLKAERGREEDQRKVVL
jgi:hypothetical protein